MVKRDSFVFYRSFYEGIKELPRDIQGEVLTAIMEYGLNGETTENLKPIARAIVSLVKPQIDANNKKFENGKKGGRPTKSETKEKPSNNLKETKEKPNNNQTETKPKPNVNVNVIKKTSKKDFLCVLENSDLEFFESCKNFFQVSSEVHQMRMHSYLVGLKTKNLLADFVEQTEAMILWKTKNPDEKKSNWKNYIYDYDSGNSTDWVGKSKKLGITTKKNKVKLRYV